MTFYKSESPTRTPISDELLLIQIPEPRKKQTELVVLENNTSVDRRLGRPRAHEVLAGFWEHALQREISDLRRLCFDTVTEHKTVSVVKHHVCPLMQAAWQWLHHAPQAEITLRNSDLNLVQTTAEQKEAWVLLHDESKLVRLMNSMLSASPQMAHHGERFHTKELDIMPQPNETGKLFAFDLLVEFGV